MPLISVIMNVRNGAPTLREAVDSVLAQSFRDWELIVWDDCSTDAGASIIASYPDSRIRYFLSPDDASLGKAATTPSSTQRVSGSLFSTRMTSGFRTNLRGRSHLLPTMLP